MQRTVETCCNRAIDIDEARPAKLVRQKARLDATDSVFGLITEFKERRGVIFYGVTLNVGEGEKAVQVRFNDRAITPVV